MNRYNHTDFAPYRHKDARAGQSMQKEHDVWALMKMTEEFFDIDLSESKPKTIEKLIQVFTEAQTCELRDVDTEVIN